MAESVAESLVRGPEALDPRVRKARGVYYTPAHVVNFIVENTLGKQLESCAKPGEVARLKVLDPACGNGCFLLGAFQALLGWHRKAGLQADIASNNLFGVDIDAEAVDSARRLLGPGMDNNILCGNSLASKELPLAFDWHAGFPSIMKSGGFDCVIGNPPYVFSRGKGFSAREKAYFSRTYRHQNYQLNTYALFIEKSLALLRVGGVCGLIVPSNWLTISSMKPFRDYLLGATGELRIVNNRYRVFPGASVDTSIVLFTKKKPGRVQLLESSGPRNLEVVASLPARELLGQSVIQIGLYRDRLGRRIVERIEARAQDLSGFCRVSTGLKAYQAGKGRPPQTREQKQARVFHARIPRDGTYRPYLEGADVCRYRLAWSGGYLSYGDWLAEPRRSVPFDGQRLLVRQIPAKPPYLLHAAYTDQPCYNDLNSMVIHRPASGVSIKYLLGLLNSRLVSFWFLKKYDKLQRSIFPQFKAGELKIFPVVPIDSGNRKLHDQLVKLVDRRLDGESIDRQIDALVYRLFGLTEKEILHIQRVAR